MQWNPAASEFRFGKSRVGCWHALFCIALFCAQILPVVGQTFTRPPFGFQVTTNSGWVEAGWKFWQTQGAIGGVGSGPLQITFTGIDTPDRYTLVVPTNWAVGTDSVAARNLVRTQTLPVRLSPGTYNVSWMNPSNFLTFGVALQEVAAWDPSALSAAIAATPSTVMVGQIAEIAWTTTGATSAVVSGPGLNSMGLSGSQAVQHAVPGTYVYGIVATGFSGSTFPASTTLIVTSDEIPPRISEFPPTISVTPSTQTVSSGSTAVLNITASGATTLSLSGTDGLDVSNPASSVSVGPSSGVTHTYTLTATGFARIRWRLTHATQVILDPPSGAPIDVSSVREFDTTEAGTWTIHYIANGVSADYTFTVNVPTVSATATVAFTSGPAPRSVTFNDSSMTFGDVFPLSASTNGDGAPTYSIVSGPGVVSSSSLSASAVGVVRVRVDYPATAGFTAATAFADVTVNPRPVTFTLLNQDFDYDGTAKTATYSLSEPAAVLAGMVNADVTKGPAANAYTVSVSASGNYVGSATATMRIFPVIDAFSCTPPPAPTVALNVQTQVQWPDAGVISWTTADAASVRVVNDAGTVISNAANGSATTGVLDVRNPGYMYTVTADPQAATVLMAQRGASAARLQGPGGLDVDVTGATSYNLSASGSYTYTVSANGLTRSATINLSMPAPATQSGILDVTPATVTAAWGARDLDGPHVVSSADMPSWQIQGGAPVVSLAQPLAWARSDDGATGSVRVGDTLYPGTNQVTATFVPPSPNYAPAAVTATWRVTAPVTVTASNAVVQVNGSVTASGTTFRILPGNALALAASPLQNYDWGTDWSAGAAVWSGSPELLTSPTAPAYTVTIPAGTGPLSIAANAYQVGPRVVSLTPVKATHVVPSGPAAGRSYPRSWNASGTWYAYLGRDGVTFDVAGEARESGIAGFEIQARPPGGDWFLLASGSPSGTTPNGPRTAVPQTFSVKLGALNPLKPLIPADPSLAGVWQIRARVQSTAGVWSSWAFEQPLNVVMPVQVLTKSGRTLPPLADADWYQASPTQTYTFTVLIP
jgi:hypothetical protein